MGLQTVPVVLGRADDGVLRVREADEVDAVLLREEDLARRRRLGAVQSQRLVVAACHQQRPGRVVVHRVDCRLLSASPSWLPSVCVCVAGCGNGQTLSLKTLAIAMRRRLSSMSLILVHGEKKNRVFVHFPFQKREKRQQVSSLK